MSTADQLTEMLERVAGVKIGINGSSCSECKQLAERYSERISTTKEKERIYNSADYSKTDEWERVQSNRIALAVKLEATTARRFLLHILERHN